LTNTNGNYDEYEEWLLIKNPNQKVGIFYYF
jgi:hypothetical protein